MSLITISELKNLGDGGAYTRIDGLYSSLHPGVRADEAQGVQDDGYIFIDIKERF